LFGLIHKTVETTTYWYVLFEQHVSTLKGIIRLIFCETTKNKNTNFHLANAILSFCNRLSNSPHSGCNDFEARRKHGSLSRNMQVNLETTQLVQ